MKKLAFVIFLFVFTTGCGKNDPVESTSGTSGNCGTHNGKQLHRGPEGGCYYINSNNNKTYVDRSECKCN
jgi:hypothetical protein